MLHTRQKSEYFMNKYFYLDNIEIIPWCAAYKMFSFAQT